jgi:hypothetical protein
MKLRTLRNAMLGVLAALGLGSVVSAQTTLSSYTFNSSLYLIDPGLLLPTWVCKSGDGTACTSEKLASPSDYRQVLVLPTGYTSAEKLKFFNDVEAMRAKMSDLPGTSVYSEAHRSRLLYISYYVPGGELSSPTSAFAGKVFAHPVRGKALTMNQEAAYAKVAEIRATTLPQLSPSVVVTLFNTNESGITANATPPSYTRRPYGIARFTSGEASGNYIGAHEVGHALLSFVDEYVESGFENMSITQFDVLTPLALWDGSMKTLATAVGNLLGIYSLRISEVIAANGADNISLSKYPSTVWSGITQEVYEYEGGFFFGRGTWHDSGKNLMNSNSFNPTPNNGFDYAHSTAQQRIVTTAFVTGKAGRANDRLRNSGPINFWWAQFGNETTVMLYDADKNHRWHPTSRYDVTVGWYEREWDVCWAGIFPYPCYENVWRSVKKSISPTVGSLQLKSSTLFGLASLTQNAFCGLGLGGLTGDLDLCTLTVDQMTSAFLPTMKFYLPYQWVKVPASQWFTTYYWSFRTYNGTYTSGWTGWASFYRSL